MPDSNAPSSAEAPCPVGPGDVLSSRYTLEHLVGEGTFGWVFSAVDVLESPPRRVAIKLLRQRYSTQEEGVRRFERRELALLLRVQELAPTPHVVRAQEPRVLLHEGHPYLVLEFIEGPSLREVMDTQPLTSADIQRWGEELARGLAAIHAAGGVHRDLKPTNIRLRGGKQPVIVDLGINRALWDTQEFTGTGQSLMTPRYASPEQGFRLDVGPESDVYSLGLILYELLTGDVPLVGEDLHAVLSAGQRSGTSTSRNAELLIPKVLSTCVVRCLHQDPRRRPKASAVAVSLAAAAGRGEGAWPRWGLVLVGLILMSVLGTAVWRSRVEPPIVHPKEWAQSFGIPKEVKRISTVVTDAENNVLIMGGFLGEVNFGGSTLKRKDLTGIFLVKLDSEENHLWSRELGDRSYWQYPAGAGFSPNGDIWIQGHFMDTLRLGPGCQKLVGLERDSFLARLNAEGRCLFALQIGGGGAQSSTRLMTTPDGGVVIGGNFTGQLKIGERALVSAGPENAFVARFSAEGALQWMLRFGSPQTLDLRSIVLGKTGDIRVTGSFMESVDLNGVTLQGSSTPSSFAATFDGGGRHVWSRRFDGVPVPDGDSISGFQSTVDEDGSVFVLETLTGAAPRHPQTTFLSRFGQEGDIRWTKQVAVCETCQWNLLGAPGGRALIWGSVGGSVDLGDGPFSGLGGKDISLLEFTPEGERSGARRFSNGLGLELYSANADSGGDWLLVGSFAGQLDFGGSRLTSDGNRSLFVAHLQHNPDVPAARAKAEFSCPPSSPALVAWYSFEDLGPEVLSIAGTAPPGRLERGALLTPGRGGRVLSPSGGFFQVPDVTTIALGSEPFSVSVWIQTSDADGTRLILDKGGEPGRRGAKVGYQLALDRGRLVFVLGTRPEVDGGHSRAGATRNFTLGRFVADGAWHLISVTVERNQPWGGVVYVDGEIVSDFDTTLYTGSVDSDVPLRVGSRSLEVADLFRGFIDDVAIWRRALSPQEVADLYQAGRAGACTGQGG